MLGSNRQPTARAQPPAPLSRDIHDLLSEDPSLITLIHRDGPQLPSRKKQTHESWKHLYPHGVPGSRRFRRHLNVLRIVENVDDDASSYNGLMSLMMVEWRSNFQSLFENPQHMAAWNKFVNSSPEEQQKIVGMQAPPSHRAHTTSKDDPAHMYSRIDKRIRLHLKKLRASCFLDQLDKAILRHILNTNEPLEITEFEILDDGRRSRRQGSRAPLVLCFKNGFHRLVAHGVCQFYSLTSRSETRPDGARVTVVGVPHGAHSRPSTSLSDYLELLHGEGRAAPDQFSGGAAVAMNAIPEDVEEEQGEGKAHEDEFVLVEEEDAAPERLSPDRAFGFRSVCGSGCPCTHFVPNRWRPQICQDCAHRDNLHCRV